MKTRTQDRTLATISTKESRKAGKRGFGKGKGKKKGKGNKKSKGR
jgi:hypothetical protein